MRYARQVQGALERLDQTLLALNRLIKQNRKEDAIRFMEEGPLKDAYEDLQSIIKTAGLDDSGLGASGTSQTGTFNR